MALALTVKLTFYAFHSQTEVTYPKALLFSFSFFVSSLLFKNHDYARNLSE